MPSTERGRRQLILRISIWNCTLSLHVKPEQGFRAINVLNRSTSKRSQILLVKKKHFLLGVVVVVAQAPPKPRENRTWDGSSVRE